jgi:hypothetical protein
VIINLRSEIYVPLYLNLCGVMLIMGDTMIQAEKLPRIQMVNTTYFVHPLKIYVTLK